MVYWPKYNYEKKRSQHLLIAQPDDNKTWVVKPKRSLTRLNLYNCLPYNLLVNHLPDNPPFQQLERKCLWETLWKKEQNDDTQHFLHFTQYLLHFYERIPLSHSI